MKEGYLSQYFVNVAAKRLSVVEADPIRSHQHEFNGTRELKKVLGTGSGEKIQFPVVFIWLGQENEAISSEGQVTWYDARRDHPTRSEYRLYFPTTDVSEMAKAGDMIFIAKRRNDTLMIILVAADSTIENQLSWLFGIPVQTELEFASQKIENEDDKEVDFVVRFILEELGIEVEEPETDYLDHLLLPFKGAFPKAKEFSKYTRSTVQGLNVFEEPDKTIMSWMEQEEKLFRRLERQIVEKRLQSGFTTHEGMDIESFMGFSLSVQNRRKSRAGLALENHLEEIFTVNKLAFSRTSITENKSKPDFLFPSDTAYHNSAYPVSLLTMLDVKTSCKDRWRQVLSKANRIQEKHLFTLEPSISEDQTDEMKTKHLQLVLPEIIHETYQPAQKQWLLKLGDFIEIAKDRQNNALTKALK